MPGRKESNLGRNECDDGYGDRMKSIYWLISDQYLLFLLRPPITSNWRHRPYRKPASISGILNPVSKKHQRVNFYDNVKFDFFFGFSDLYPVLALDNRQYAFDRIGVI